MENKYEIRLINNEDTAAALAIYRPYVLNTAITFDYEVPSLDEFADKIKACTAEYPWLVCMQGEKMLGYAYGSRHRYKTAYQWSPESTIYMDENAHGKGIGRVLYNTLFELLRLQGYFNVFAGVALPNEKSEGFHRAMGFEEIGDYKKIGYKLGKWHDVKWFQFHLQEHIDNPPMPATIAELADNTLFHEIINSANAQFEK